MPQHNKNWMYRLGHSDYTDQDYIREFGLSPALAGKEEINKAILDTMRNRMSEAISTMVCQKEKHVHSLLNRSRRLSRPLETLASCNKKAPRILSRTLGVIASAFLSILENVIITEALLLFPFTIANGFTFSTYLRE